jgi:hypothetical protein
MHVMHPRRATVALLATTAYFFALAQIAASHHLNPRQAANLLPNRGIEMTAILTRLASAVIAVSLSGAVLSVALV